MRGAFNIIAKFIWIYFEYVVNLRRFETKLNETM